MSRQHQFLEEINNIGEEFTKIDENEFSENEAITAGNDEFEYTGSDDEDENIGSVCRRRTVLSSFEEEVEK